jgi:hypothetical protein
MFKLSIDDRISSWAQHRAHLESSSTPLDDVAIFWAAAPFVPYNNNIDPYHQQSWPTPWEIIVENKYDDFTRALMMAYSLKFTERFNNSVIELKTCLDKHKNIYYNIVCIDDEWVLNYNDNSTESVESLPDSFSVENLIEVSRPR